jgi:hypothetical protein
LGWVVSGSHHPQQVKTKVKTKLKTKLKNIYKNLKIFFYLWLQIPLIHGNFVKVYEEVVIHNV